MAAKLIPESIRDVLDYDPETGVFTWLQKTNRRIKEGAPAGRVWDGGRRGKYIRIGYQGTKHYGHRLAWFFVYNEQPDVIDHINHDTLDNRIINLRNVDHATNMTNRSATGIRWAWVKTKSKGRIYRYFVVIAQYKRIVYQGKSILLAWFARIMAERADHPIALPSPSSARQCYP